MSAFLDAFATVLAFFYDLIPNYAVAITLLTLVVMVVVTPLTLKGTRSMMVMQRLQPEMKKIQQRYKDDREKLNAELLKFYKENDINPLGGCLPLLVQAPVFLVLYQVLRGLTRRASDVGFDVGWVSGQLGLGADPGTAPEIVRVFDPAYLDPSTAMYQALHTSTTMTSFGIDLAESPSQAWSTGFLHFLPFLALIAVVAVTGFVQQRQIQGRNPNAQINPQQQMIMRIMPVFLPVISFGLPAGLVLYFAVSNLYRIGQQAFISRSIYGISRKDRAGQRAKEKEKGKGGKGSASARGGGPNRGKQPKAGTEVIDVAGTEQAEGGSEAPPSAPSTDQPAKKAPTRSPSRSGKSGSGSGSGSRATGSSTLQPRARRNKKR